jgi:parvulin-like peptidyl-prolyl isomerase
LTPARLAIRPKPEELVRMTRSQGFVLRSRLLLPALLVALAAAGCGKAQEGHTLVTTGSRRLTVEQFEEYARNDEVMQPYFVLPESAQKKALFEDLLSYEVLAEAGVRAGFDKDSAYTHIETDALPRLLPDALYDTHIGSTVKVSESEARIFYDGQNEEHRLAVIALADEASAKAALARLDAGTPFAEVAKTMSIDPNAARTGGEIPSWVTLGQLPLDVEKAIAPLKPGEHTGVIAQPNGSYIFTLLEKRPRKDPPPFDQNKQEIVKMLESRKKGALVAQYLGGLKKQYELKLDGPGWTVVGEKVLQMPDSTARWLATDPKRAGLTDDELKQTVATWTGRTYTVHDFIKDMTKAEVNDRPPAGNVPLAKVFVEGKAMNEILVAEAKKEKLDKSAKVTQQINRAKSSYLVNKYVEKTLPPGGVGFPTPAQLDSAMNAMVQASGQQAPPNLTFAALPPQLQQQIVADWQTKHRQALLKAEVERLKAELKPVVDEKAFQAIPWPVPAEAEKEKA